MPITDQELKTLEEKAYRLRQDIIDVTGWAGGAHIGGALSMVEMLVLLYFKYADINPQEPAWEERDRIVVSKGHGGVGYAAVLPYGVDAQYMFYVDPGEKSEEIGVEGGN